MHIAPIRAGRIADGHSRTPLPLRTTSGDVCGSVSLADAAVIGPTLRETARAAHAWRRTGIATRIAIAAEAASRLIDDALPIGDQHHTLAESMQAISHLAGLPQSCVDAGFAAIAEELSRMESILCAASPTGTLDVFEARGVRPERRVHWTPRGDVAAIIAPGNVVGAHGVWAPLISAGYPIVLKPSTGDPVTPLRIISAFVAAGAPAELFSVLPLDADAVPMLTRLAPASVAFGDDDTLAALPHVTRAYGPGRAVSIVSDEALMQESIREAVLAGLTDDAGRACVNTSVLIVIGDGEDGLHSLAADLAAVAPEPLLAPNARLGALPTHVANAWAARLDAAVAAGGHDYCAVHRGPYRTTRGADGTYLLPSLIVVQPDAAELAWEVPAPAAWAVRWPDPARAPDAARSLRALAVSVFIDNEPLWASLCDAPGVGKLLRGLPTTRVDLRLPHDGYVTDGLYVRKAVCHV